jgi:mono/diheme cytochrome c family protein
LKALLRFGVVAALLLCAALGALLWPSAPIAVGDALPVPVDTQTLARGRELAILGNCGGCHSVPGGPPFGGGREFPTSFGVVVSSNLTAGTGGLAGWSEADFWRALRHGQTPEGRWLLPAFPFVNTAGIAREDSLALFAYLRSLPPVTQPAPSHRLDWPFNTQAALKIWRALYFRLPPSPSISPRSARATPAERGDYLVRVLGHCSACHAPRNALAGGKDLLALTGGLMPVARWYAPSLHDPREAGLQDWPAADIVTLFAEGRTGSAQIGGPMAEVVAHSTQHWPRADLEALAVSLRQLPQIEADRARIAARDDVVGDAAASGEGARLYEHHCSDCHGARGEGRRLADGHYAYPPLAGNRAVTMASATNLIQVVLNGGFPTATAGHPRPFGMPPFVLVLDDAQVSAVLTHVRSAWGNAASPVPQVEVQRLRGQGSR